MSVTFVRVLKRGRSGTRELGGGKRTYTQVFLVGTDSPLDGSQIARTAIDPKGGPVIPQPGTFYVAGNEFDLGCFIKSVEAHEVGETGMLWEVSVTADSEMPDPPRDQENPLDRPPEVSWSFAQFQRVAEKDMAGNAILNSAGQPFDPPIQVDDSRPVCDIERNEDTFDPNIVFAYKDAINSDALDIGGLTVLPGQAKMSNIGARRQFENSQYYWKVNYQIQVKADGWALSILDQGWYKTGNNGKPTPCLDDQGNEVTSPVLLDGNGGQLTLPPAPAGQPGGPFFKTFDVYPELPFAALALP